jgi:hypothetical protein
MREMSLLRSSTIAVAIAGYSAAGAPFIENPRLGPFQALRPMQTSVGCEPCPSRPAWLRSSESGAHKLQTVSCVLKMGLLMHFQIRRHEIAPGVV